MLIPSPLDAPRVSRFPFCFHPSGVSTGGSGRRTVAGEVGEVLGAVVGLMGSTLLAGFRVPLSSRRLARVRSAGVLTTVGATANPTSKSPISLISAIARVYQSHLRKWRVDASLVALFSSPLTAGFQRFSLLHHGRRLLLRCPLQARLCPPPTASRSLRLLLPPPYPGYIDKGFATLQSTSSLNDQNPNWSNRPRKETILLEGCDFEHWLVVMEPPYENATRDKIMDSYIKTLAMVLGSEEEARMKIYSVSTKCYFAFGALVSKELSHKIKELPGVLWVLPDSYIDVNNKAYGGEPFINGQAVPYDPKYHEEWLRDNSPAIERKRCRDRPRNFTRMEDVQIETDKTANYLPTGLQAGSPDHSISVALSCLNEMKDILQSSEMYLDAFEILPVGLFI